jgi:nucleotide-binding universal stress UspA family protein
VDRKMKILIGYDGSTYANSTLKDLRRAGLALEAQTIVISIPTSLQTVAARNGQANAPFAYSDEEVEKAAAMAKQASELIREYFPNWEVRAEVAVGSIVRNVAKKAKQWNPDLIVLGLEDAAANNRNYFGDISQQIAAAANCSVRVARGLSGEPDDAPRVLLCVDDSPYAQTAVNAVAARNWPKGTEVRILTVVDPFDYSIPELLDSAIARAKSRHRLIAYELDRTPAFTSSFVKKGDAAKVILKEAQQWNPNAIFLAPRNQHKLHRLLLDSVSSAVVARAQCPVELVRTVRATSSTLSFQQTPTTSPAYD